MLVTVQTLIETLLTAIFFDVLLLFYANVTFIIFKNSTTDLKLAIFNHIKIKTILILGLHFPSVLLKCPYSYQ